MERAQDTLELTVNGVPHGLRAEATVAGLLRELKLTPASVAVELNGRLVRRGEHASRALAGGDQVEIVTLVGGG